MTGNDLIASSLRLIGVLASGETPTANEANDALNSLNQMLDTWSTQNLLIPSKVYETFSLVVNQQAYQMGSGAPDFNTARPQKIENINFQQVSGTTKLELPIEIVNQDQWAAISIKGITSNLPTRMWPQYLYPYATLNFWPIPNISGSVVIWSWKPLTTVATLATALSVPPGYIRALRYNLGVELAPEYGRALNPVIIENAVESKAAIKRMNTPVTLLGIDAGALPKRSTLELVYGGIVRFPGFIGPTYQLASIEYESQRCINLYPEINELGTGKDHEVASLIGTPGYSLFTDLGFGPIRGLWYSSTGVLYAVCSNILYSVSSAGVSTNLGLLLTSTGNVGMADNGIQLVIVDGTYGYYVTMPSGALTQIVDVNFLGSNQVHYQDGYFIMVTPNSTNFYISDLNAVTFSSPALTAKNGTPDNIVAHVSSNRNLWLLGDRSLEIWFNSGNALTPFQYIAGTLQNFGCAAAWSVTKMANTLFWLGKDQTGSGIVFMANGYNAQRISTQAIELAIQGYSSISDAIGYAYQENGHQFYVLNFPTGNATWAYDISSQMWHERAYMALGVLGRHRGNYYAYAYNTHILADYATGNLYNMNSQTYTDNGNPILRQRISPHISKDMDRIFYESLQLDCETEIGLDGIGQGTNPQVMLQWSDDGGHTWSNEYWAPMCAIGQTIDRTIWRRLGRGRNRVFKVSISDPVQVIMIGAEIELEVGES